MGLPCITTQVKSCPEPPKVDRTRIPDADSLAIDKRRITRPLCVAKVESSRFAAACYEAYEAEPCEKHRCAPPEHVGDEDGSARKCDSCQVIG